MKMNGDTSIAIVLSIFFLSIAGCCVGIQHEDDKVAIEKEKTKQLEIQARMDSLKINENNTH